MTVSVTVAVFGVAAPPVPEPLTVIVAVYVPATSPVVLTTTAVEVAVPLAGDKVSHVLSDEAAQLSVPPPELVILKV